MSEKIVLNVEGMTCTNCAQGIARFLEKKGLKSVQVDFSSGEVAFEEVPTSSVNEIVQGIHSLGYKVIDTDKEQEGKNLFSSRAVSFVFEKAVLGFPSTFPTSSVMDAKSGATRTTALPKHVIPSCR